MSNFFKSYASIVEQNSSHFDLFMTYLCGIIYRLHTIDVD